MATKMNTISTTLHILHNTNVINARNFAKPWMNTSGIAKAIQIMIHFFLSGGGMKVVYPRPHQFQVNGCEEAVKMYISM